MRDNSLQQSQRIKLKYIFKNHVPRRIASPSPRQAAARDPRRPDHPKALRPAAAQDDLRCSSVGAADQQRLGVHRGYCRGKNEDTVRRVEFTFR